MNISLPKDLIEIIEQLIVYEDMLKEKKENFEYEYAYIEDAPEIVENDKEDTKETVIKISL